MPLHEYCCSQCSTEFEELVFRDDDAVACPQCGSDQVDKLISACKFRTGGPIIAGSPTTNPATRSTSACAGCSGGNCSTC